MKKILALILTSFLLLSLCACGDKGGVSSEALISVGKTEEVEVKAAENVFPENTVVEIKTITSGDSYKAVDTALKTAATKFEVYDITATSDNVAVQPNGTVKATFDVPTEYDLDKVGVVYISDDGNVETLSCNVNKESKTVTAQLSHFSLYAVIEKVEAETESTVASDESSSADVSEVTSDDKTSSKPEESSKPAHTHTFANATCTEAKKCACGATEGKALGHDYIDGKCLRCGAVDTTYKALLSGEWTVDAVSGNRLYAFAFKFTGEPFVSVGIGDNTKTLPQDFQDEITNNPADYADSIYKVGNESYYVGMGDGRPFTFTVDKNTVVITEIDSTNTITLNRTAGDKYTVTAVSGDFMQTNNAVKVGLVFSWQKESEE